MDNVCIQVLHPGFLLQIISAYDENSSPQKNIDRRKTYHQRRSARKILAALPGVKIREMDRSMQNALCCGGGGGNLFTDILGNGPESPAKNRVMEALGTDAHIMAVSCPSCAVMLGDAVKSTNLDERIQVREISEIVNNRLKE